MTTQGPTNILRLILKRNHPPLKKAKGYLLQFFKILSRICFFPKCAKKKSPTLLQVLQANFQILQKGCLGVFGK